MKADEMIDQVAQTLKGREKQAEPVIAKTQQFAKELYAGVSDVLAKLIQLQTPGVTAPQALKSGNSSRLRFLWHKGVFLFVPFSGAATAPNDIQPHLSRPTGRIGLFTLERDNEHVGKLFRDYYIDERGRWAFTGFSGPAVMQPFTKEMLEEHAALLFYELENGTTTIWRSLDGPQPIRDTDQQGPEIGFLRFPKP